MLSGNSFELEAMDPPPGFARIVPLENRYVRTIRNIDHLVRGTASGSSLDNFIEPLEMVAGYLFTIDHERDDVPSELKADLEQLGIQLQYLKYIISVQKFTDNILDPALPLRYNPDANSMDWKWRHRALVAPLPGDRPQQTLLV